MKNFDTIFSRLNSAKDFEIKSIIEALKPDYVEINRETTIDFISKEYRSVSGNSAMNIFRDDHEFPYKQILIDVADKMKPGYSWTNHSLKDQTSEETIEDEILSYMEIGINERLGKLSEDERKALASDIEKKLEEQVGHEAYFDNAIKAQITGAIAAGTVSALFAGPAALALFYSGFWGGISAFLFGINSSLLLAGGAVLFFPIAILAATAFAMSTSYGKSIPVTIVMISIRKRIEAEKEFDAILSKQNQPDV